jgi:hypothetical protein
MFAGRLGPIKQMMQTVRAAQNPQLALQQMAQQNPQLQQALQLVQQSGGNPQAAFEKLARQNGIDPQQILQMIQGI